MKDKTSFNFMVKVDDKFVNIQACHVRVFEGVAMFYHIPSPGEVNIVASFNSYDYFFIEGNV
jgi:hypothetical protein